MWVVRAGKGSEFISDFLEHNVVALGWIDLGDLSIFRDPQQLTQRVLELWPAYPSSKARMIASHLYRFAHVLKKGDLVLSYDSGTRIHHLGKIIGDYRFQESLIPGMPHVRDIKWEGQISRDLLSTSAKNRIGSIATLFQIADSAAAEILSLARGDSPSPLPVKEDTAPIEDDEFLLEDIQARSRELIKDKLDKLDWDQMQEVVAGMLRAMGYKTRVSKAGPDRGKDIIASPDGFGFESPRILVEVKHRKGQMGAQEIRSFLGGRHKDDKGLYVSTGGFSKDARYEADRASIPVMLMDLNDLADSILDYYEGMDEEMRSLVPLTKIYWPT